MKLKNPKPNFFEVVENMAMYLGFLCIILLIIINLFRWCSHGHGW